jgi:hypothetical protein
VTVPQPPPGWTLPPGPTTGIYSGSTETGANTAAGGGVGGGGRWRYPDYASLIAGDPTLQGAIAQIAASGAAAGREKMNAIRRAVVQAGFVPSGWTGSVGDIDQATLTAAQQNPLSQARQLVETREHGRADLAAALAGRGMLASGALTGGEQSIQTGYERGQATATQNLLDALAGYEGSYAQAMRELELARMQEQEAAASRIMSTYQPWQEPEAATAAGGGAAAPATPAAVTGGGAYVAPRFPFPIGRLPPGIRLRRGQYRTGMSGAPWPIGLGPPGR